MRVAPQTIAIKYLEDLSDNIMRCAANADVDAVHNLRVAVRRTTQVLRIFEDQFPHAVARKLRCRIRKVRNYAAPVRDRDVIHELLLKLKLPPSDPACAFLRGERAMAACQLQKYLGKLIRRGKPKSWIDLLEAKE